MALVQDTETILESILFAANEVSIAAFGQHRSMRKTSFGTFEQVLLIQG